MHCIVSKIETSGCNIVSRASCSADLGFLSKGGRLHPVINKGGLFIDFCRDRKKSSFCCMCYSAQCGEGQNVCNSQVVWSLCPEQKGERYGGGVFANANLILLHKRDKL